MAGIRKKSLSLLLILMSLTMPGIFSACGYRFAGSGTLPAGIKRIFVVIPENRTAETGIERVFADDVVNEFIRRNETALANDMDGADAVMYGVIGSMGVETITHTGAYTSDTRRVTIGVTYRLVDKYKRTLWSGVLSENEAYDVADDKFATDQNRRNAIETLSKRMAEKLYNRLTADF
ncbi:MAG: LPS assembly lipoprotein LptE [Thermodesulfobacteriota bacterium]